MNPQATFTSEINNWVKLVSRSFDGSCDKAKSNESRIMEITCQQIMDWVDENIPTYLENTEDYQISDGNVALCMVEKDGTVHGKMYGNNMIRQRNSFFYAWQKASQVWITGISTGEFERRVFNNEINEYVYGINRPDYIGWIGGQPLTLENGEILAIAFSGFRGETDIQLISEAIEQLKDKQQF